MFALKSDGGIKGATCFRRNSPVFEKSIHSVAPYQIKIWQLFQAISQCDLPLVPLVVAELSIKVPRGSQESSSAFHEATPRPLHVGPDEVRLGNLMLLAPVVESH